jgi:hypothetical protein
MQKQKNKRLYREGEFIRRVVKRHFKTNSQIVCIHLYYRLVNIPCIIYEYLYTRASAGKKSILNAEHLRNLENDLERIPECGQYE